MVEFSRVLGSERAHSSSACEILVPTGRLAASEAHNTERCARTYVSAGYALLTAATNNIRRACILGRFF